ncbi:PAS domain S-box protein [Nonomuraea sp. NPDC049504]|uniref:PAS domain-containing sensor histidine kinase n=1 Tax=Nonomuraea sp. NPDC049504 TaxID=3154729 RepID=UPI003415B58D
MPEHDPSPDVMSQLVQSIRDPAILMLDPHGVVLSWNAGAERITGYTAGEAVGAHFSLSYPPAGIAAGDPARALAAAASGGRWEEECWRVRKDGTRFWAGVAITALRDAAGALRGFGEVTHDLTTHHTPAGPPGERPSKRPATAGGERGLTEQRAAGTAAGERELRERGAAGTAAGERELRERGAAGGAAGERELLVSRQAQERERRRIASGVHDDTIQSMVAVGMRLRSWGASLPAEQAATVRALDDDVNAAVLRLRDLAFALRPPADGLVDSLAGYLERTMPAAGLTHELRHDLDTEPPDETVLAVYRICQEALTNVRRHAAARHVTVMLRSLGAGVHVRVRDDGAGLSPAATEPGHFGLIEMRERAETAGGWWTILGPPGAGTTVEFWIPTPPPAGHT